MTYENFCNKMHDKDSSTDRKDIRYFAIRFALIVFISAIATGIIVSKILGSFFLILFLLLSLLLYVWSFDLFVENDSIYRKILRVSKFWWLYSLLVVISCILINNFVL